MRAFQTAWFAIPDQSTHRGFMVVAQRILGEEIESEVVDGYPGTCRRVPTKIMNPDELLS